MDRHGTGAPHVRLTHVPSPSVRCLELRKLRLMQMSRLMLEAMDSTMTARAWSSGHAQPRPE
eukprot:1154023-Pelagomonas_calceolata.AAC.1